MNRSTIISLIACAAAGLLLCHSCGKKKDPFQADCRIVSTNSGLNLRETPSRSGKIMALIPFRNVVEVTGKGLKTETIEGKRGTWLPVSWFGKKGWAFDAFLAKEGKSDCRPFYLYPYACYDQDALHAVFSKLDQKVVMEGLEVSPSLFNPPPSMLPGQPVVVITRDGIKENWIKALHAGGSVTFQALNFSLASPMPGSKDERSGEPLYIRKQDLASLAKNPPRHVKLAALADSAESTRITALVAVDAAVMASPGKDGALGSDSGGRSLSSLIIAMPFPNTVRDAKELIAKNFKARVYPLSGGKDANGPFVVEFRGGSYYEFYGLVLGGKTAVLENGVVSAVFALDEDLYVAATEWGPHSGRMGRALYRLKKGKLEKIVSEIHPFAD